MDIELWYDPIMPKTSLKIDGKWQDSNDVYGFLHPVNIHILQTWLYESSSWSGLEKQFRDLLGGEQADIIFHGRQIDFVDLSTCLSKKQVLSLSNGIH